jgi:thymidylate synthase (FAD)
MILIKPSSSIEFFMPDPCEVIERGTRTCYQTTPKGDAAQFVRNRVSDGHMTTIEQGIAIVRFIVPRHFTHELVRHRIATYQQESTRFCDYSVINERSSGQVKFIIPYWTDFFDEFCDGYRADKRVEEKIRQVISHTPRNAEELACKEEMDWFHGRQADEYEYIHADGKRKEPNEKRGCLPLDLKTEIVMTANFNEWLHVFTQRTAMVAHPQMRAIMRPLLAEFRARLPEIFEGIGMVDDHDCHLMPVSQHTIKELLYCLRVDQDLKVQIEDFIAKVESKEVIM